MKDDFWQRMQHCFELVGKQKTNLKPFLIIYLMPFKYVENACQLMYHFPYAIIIRM